MREARKHENVNLAFMSRALTAQAVSLQGRRNRLGEAPLLFLGDQLTLTVS